MQVRRASEAERPAHLARLADYWGDPLIARGETWRLADCELFIAGAGEGLASVSGRDRPVAELVTINAFEAGRGIGGALLTAVAAALAGDGFIQLRLTTTNDNLDALRFYQRRGFRLAALRPGAVTEARRIKPSIPLVGEYGIPLIDELDLILEL